MQKNNRFDDMVARMAREFPSFRLVPKDDSLLMKVFYHALGMRWWCPDFMTHYTTVIISAVYMPRDLFQTDEGYGVLRHERVHMHDCWRTGVLPFALSYLLLLPAVFTLRAHWEMRGYAETMRVELEDSGAISDETLDHIQEQFTGPTYLWMCPFPGYVRRWLERVREQVLQEETELEP